MALPTLPPLREVIARHGLNAKKSLGQNFLTDTNLLDRIARIPGLGPESRVYEVGPGPGGLTRALQRLEGAMTIPNSRPVEAVQIGSARTVFRRYLHLLAILGSK